MTLATASRPLWSEGMLMCPQHMHQQDLYHEQHLHARLQALSAAPWGVTSVLFDTSALWYGTREEFAEGAERILKVFTGCPFHIWQTYDDQYWKQPGFWLARSVRNHPNWGPRLFKALTS